ncbi:glycosyltransferase [Sphingomonas sp. HF-S4]|uniref:Glycosyltransferase n=1 Tax=Sphingomonas agrestis TaxID=3080540 RepID=A0ABU3Y7W6_9SPHN|nr:glycosyltransferase [Sphingomonas sp. HF-S4]MDV3457268.1 glycosyltransferase [Sphingomonas sp. HF-S4]
MLRVAHLVPNLLAGGRERMVADLCARAADFGIDAQVIAYDPHAEGQRIAVDVPVHPLDRNLPDLPGRLNALVAAERIDVLHAQGHVPAALAAGIPVPMVATLHVALGSGWRWLPAIRRGLRVARQLTAVSDDLARRFRFVAGRRIETVLPGLDLARFDVARGRDTAFTLGIAARLHPVKRHHDAIAALRLLAARGMPCRLRIAGEGALDTELRAAAYGLDVRFDGPVADMPRWLAGLDAFLLPSDHEGTPLALLEAAASGLPCIATAVGGTPAALGEAALWVPRRRPKKIAEAIATLVADPARSQAMGAAARRRVQAFGLDRSCTRYRAIYDRSAAAATA